MKDNELKHYGVLGMRWGHRNAKDGNDSGSSSKAKKEAKISNGKKALTTVLAVAGGLTLAAATAKFAYDFGAKAGRTALQNEITAKRKASARKAAETRAMVKAMLASVDY